MDEKSIAEKALAKSAWSYLNYSSNQMINLAKNRQNANL